MPHKRVFAKLTLVPIPPMLDSWLEEPSQIDLSGAERFRQKDFISLDVKGKKVVEYYQ